MAGLKALRNYSNCFGPLEFGNDWHIASTSFTYQGSHRLQVAGTPDEADGDHVNPKLESKGQVLNIFFSDWRHIERDTRSIDSFVFCSSSDALIHSLQSDPTWA